MHKGMILSGLLHAAVLVIAIFGLPNMWQRIEITDHAIPVEIVDIGELTNAPPPKAEPKEIEQEAKKEDPKPEKKPPPPPPEPEPPKAATPVPPPKPEKKETKAKPEPKPEPKVEPKVEKKPEPKPKPVQEARAKAQAKPKRRPKPPPEDFTSVLKTVEKIKRKKSSTETSKSERQTASVSGARNIPDQPLTISELDAIRRQFISCWNVDPGLRDIEKMVVEVRVRLNSDRTVRDARLLTRINPGNAFERSFAESALRAVRNPRCSPVRLPPKKFELLKTFTLRFSAKEMLGL